MINRLPKQYKLPSDGQSVSPTHPATGMAESAQGLKDKALSIAAQTVGSRPVVSLSMAFAMGILLGKLVKR
jgi:hypothetical protein